MFLEKSTDSTPVGTRKYQCKCEAYGCPICSPESSSNINHFVCDLHSKAERSKWQLVTQRIRANKWLFDLQTYIRTVPSWHLRPMGEACIKHINSIAEENNCPFLVLPLDSKMHSADYEGKFLWPAMQDIVLLGKDPSSLGETPPPAEESFPEDEDFPF